jgi:hypothetical protein
MNAVLPRGSSAGGDQYARLDISWISTAAPLAASHRTTDNKIDGAVLTLVDLEGKKESYADKASNRAKQGPQRK